MLYSVVHCHAIMEQYLRYQYTHLLFSPGLQSHQYSHPLKHLLLPLALLGTVVPRHATLPVSPGEYSMMAVKWKVELPQCFYHHLVLKSLFLDDFPEMIVTTISGDDEDFKIIHYKG